MSGIYQPILTALCVVGWAYHLFFGLTHARLLHTLAGIYGPFAAVDGWFRLLGLA